MPILRYFGFVGAALLALLFVADATLDKGPPAVTTSNMSGLPKPWKADTTQTLASTPGPAPDMSSDAVAAAAAQKPAEPAPQQIAKVEPPKKKKHVAAAPRPTDEWRRSFAWQRNDSPFGGGNATFGRF